VTYLGIELLNVLTGPDISTLEGQENVSLVGGDLDHHDIINNSANQSTNDLGAERRFQRELCVLPKLQVLHHTNALNDRVVPKEDKGSSHTEAGEEPVPGKSRLCCIYGNDTHDDR
jgi:hypothetical protein